MIKPTAAHAKELAHGLAMATAYPFNQHMTQMIESDVYKFELPQSEADKVHAAIRKSIEAYVDTLSGDEAKYMLAEFAIEQGTLACVKTSLEAIEKAKAKFAQEGEGFAA